MHKANQYFDTSTERAQDLPPVEAVSELIGSIYDCALDPALWDAALDGIADMLRCCNATLVNFDLTQRRGGWSKVVGIDPESIVELERYLPEVASWETLPVARNWPVDEPQILSRDLPKEIFSNSRMLNEWGKPRGIVDTMAIVLMHSPTRHAQVGLGRHRDFGLIGPREAVLGRMLAPHIRRAAIISDVIDLKTLEAASANQMLDQLSVGVVNTDSKGHILHANRAAEAMLKAGNPIGSANGIIHTGVPAATDELLKAVALADGNEAALGPTGISVKLTHTGEAPVLAHVLPLKHGDARPRLQPRTTAAIFIGRVSTEANGAEAIAVAYDLTRMETRVLAGLLRGQRLAEVAAGIGIATSTARTHLHRVFGKTGTARQADLMRLGSAMAGTAPIVDG